MHRLKKMFVIFLSVLLLPIHTSYGAGSGNIDGGGGDLNQGKDGYTWPDIGYDGVRVTVVETISGQPVSNSIDYTNLDILALTQSINHFGKHSKIDYRNGAGFSVRVGNYHCKKSPVPLPQIISGNSKKASIEAIRAYFCSEAAAIMIAKDTGIPFKEIEAGTYKLVIEPVIYLIYQHSYFAMTTTEAGLYNQITGGDLGKHFPTVVMKNLALALYLERDDLGFPAWTGPTTSARSTEQMISVLGIGIISYQGEPPTQVLYDREYRTDTDVILSVRLTTGSKKTPNNPAYAKFIIDGRSYTHNTIYMPENGSQLAWVKWHTPSKPGTVTIRIQSNCNTSVSQIVAKVVDLNENPPPDPRANDRNDGFSISPKPVKPNATSLSWGEWDCWWHEYWVWHSGDEDEEGYYTDEGWWQYQWIPYHASLTAAFQTKPDEKSPTASGKQMKSGYGLNASVSAQVRSNAPSSQITGIQNAVAYFPEFNYKTYWRLLKRLDTGLSSSFEFQKNKYSTYGRPVHFTPPYFPDGRYTTYVECTDAWTPAGMLHVSMTDDLTIRDSVFSDWHIGPAK